MRVCAVETCNANLSMYNEEKACAACMRAGRKPKYRQRTTKDEAPHLRAYRKQMGWSEQTLAVKAGVSRKTIWRAEKGEEIGISSIARIAKPLNLKVGDLTGRGKG